MITLLLRSIASVLIFMLVACSAPPAKASFQAGTDFQVLPQTPTANSPGNKIVVIEFFSYGCPWCYHLEPQVENWLVHKPKDVQFERVPVVFEQGWDILAKIYYTAKALGVADKLMLPAFTALQDQNKNLTDNAVLYQFVKEHGVNQQDFESAYNFSPGIDAQMMRGDKLIKQYGIFAVPTFVINGKYVTNMGMAGGDSKRLLDIVNYLINKEQRGEQAV